MSDVKLPEDERIYAIGDIHGCGDLLDPLIARIAQDIAAHPDARAELIFLGDYIDRGPNSRAVIDRLTGDDLPAPATFLMGNHEEMLLNFMKQPADWRNWIFNGGGATLASYDIAADELRNHPHAVRDRVLKAMPAAHLQFFETLQLFATRGEYFFCHAGVRPGVPLDRQDPSDLIWIRESFLHHKGDFGKVVVHGHTPVQVSEERPNRIGIDTGGFIWGRLSAVMLSGNERKFIDVVRQPPDADGPSR